MSIFAFKTQLTSYTLLDGANKPNKLNAFREMIEFMQNLMHHAMHLPPNVYLRTRYKRNSASSGSSDSFQLMY